MRPEQQLHFAVASFLHLCLDPQVFWTTIGHGVYAGEGRRMRGAMQRRAGQKAGVPDILIVHRGQAHWIELKAPRGRTTDAQDVVHDALQRAGCRVSIARSIDDVKEKLIEWSIPTRFA